MVLFSDDDDVRQHAAAIERIGARFDSSRLNGSTFCRIESTVVP